MRKSASRVAKRSWVTVLGVGILLTLSGCNSGVPPELSGTGQQGNSVSVSNLGIGNRQNSHSQTSRQGNTTPPSTANSTNTTSFDATKLVSMDSERQVGGLSVLVNGGLNASDVTKRPAKGKQWIVANITITNTADQSVILNQSMFTLFYNDATDNYKQVAFKPSAIGNTAYRDTIFDRVLRHGDTVKGGLVFELPDSITHAMYIQITVGTHKLDFELW